MPNYRLNFKMTGTTVPATAGYYGQHDQTENLYKLAGSSMYLWKSKVTANKFYLGTTAFGDATAKFSCSTISGTWAAINSGTGTPVYSEYTLAEALDTAEKAVFDSLKAFIGGTEDVNCFRGYIPVNANGTPKFANVWMIESGGNAGAFDIERTYGTTPLWCNQLINADLQGIFENRSTALHFCGAVETWLKQNSNMNKLGLITWCRLRALPNKPEEKILTGKRYWEVNIPLEILFNTESVHS